VRRYCLSMNREHGPIAECLMSYSGFYAFFTLAACSGKRNASVWRPSVRPSVPSFPTLIAGARGTYSTWVTRGSTRSGQRTFPSEYYEDGHACLVRFMWFSGHRVQVMFCDSLMDNWNCIIMAVGTVVGLC